MDNTKNIFYKRTTENNTPANNNTLTWKVQLKTTVLCCVSNGTWEGKQEDEYDCMSEEVH